MKKMLVVLIALFAIIFMIASFFGKVYNQLVTKEESVKSAWSQVENVYQRRLDLIPNLVETVKGYAAHERQTLEAVITARSKISEMKVTPELVNDPQALQQFQQAQGSLSSALSRLMVIVEKYPDLKANENFMGLQAQLEGTENRISVERKRYNDVAQEFNTFRRIVPNIIVANILNFREKAYFQADEAASRAPKVQF